MGGRLNTPVVAVVGRDCPHCASGHVAVLRAATGEWVHNWSVAVSRQFSTVVCVGRGVDPGFRVAAAEFLRVRGSIPLPALDLARLPGGRNDGHARRNS